MQRFGKLYRIRPESIDEYEKAHAQMWPEMYYQPVVFKKQILVYDKIYNALLNYLFYILYE